MCAPRDECWRRLGAAVMLALTAAFLVVGMVGLTLVALSWVAR